MEVGNNKKMKKKKKIKKFKEATNIIDRIENTRTKNNINWMNILRIAMKYSPEETKNLAQAGQADYQIILAESTVCSQVQSINHVRKHWIHQNL